MGCVFAMHGVTLVKIINIRKAQSVLLVFVLASDIAKNHSTENSAGQHEEI